MKLEGVWLPIITPFSGDEIDFDSYRRLIEHYVSKGIAGIMPAATTGESPALSDDELERIIEKTIEYTQGRIPIMVGLGGNYTDKVIKTLRRIDKFPIEGILSPSPYYNRPDQRGIYEHFRKISESTRLNIVIYNIPYRTGRNVENATIHKLAELKNIVGLKDACGDIRQSMELILNPPADFSILTGEDILYYLTLTLGGHGGILASAHLATEYFVAIYDLMKTNNHSAALPKWKKLAAFIPLLFEEPNPSPIKYCLNKMGLIHSAETRLPLVGITEELKEKLKQQMYLS